MRKLLLLLLVASMFLFVPLVSSSIDTNLISYWNFDSNVSDNLIDVNTGRNNGTGISDTENITGIIGQAWFFESAASRYVDLSDPVELQPANDFSISLWFNTSDASGSAKYLFRKRGDGYAILMTSLGRMQFSVTNTTSTLSVNTTTNVNDSAWHNVVLTRSTTSFKTYFDGVLINNLSTSGAMNYTAGQVVFGRDGDLSSGHFDGTIDETGMWNKTLTQEDVTLLYNGGQAIPFPFKGITVTLGPPTNNTKTFENSVIFNSTINPSSDINLDNATLSVWFTNGTLFNATTNLITGNSLNVSTWNISSLPREVLLWNVFACGTNTSSDTICNFADNNFTLEVQKFTVEGESFNFNVFETSSQAFKINITTISSILSVSASLLYNGTSHIADTVSCNASSFCQISKEIDIPIVTSGTEQNKSFSWNITVFDGSESFTSQSDELQQNVSSAIFGQCSATVANPTLNFTAFDEQTNLRIDPFYMAAEFTYWLGNGTVTKPFSFSNLSSSELNLCLSLSSTNFFIEDTIEYNDVINSTTYNTRNYFFQRDILNDTLRHIPLFLLNSDDSTSFILKVQDTNLLPVSNALILIQRFDIGTGNFTTVQIAKTDDNGQTVGFFKTETVDYRFIIRKNGVTLLETSQQKVIPETAPFTLTFTVGADVGAPWTRFEDIPNLVKALIFNSTTEIVTFTYSDTSTDFSLARLLVVRQNQSGFATTICDLNSTLASAILSCNTQNITGTYTASAFVTRGSDTFLAKQIIFSVQSFSDVVGLYGVFLAWFIILISAFAFKFNEIAGIVLMNLTVIMVNLIGLVNFGFLFIFGMMGVSIFIIVLLER